MKQLTAIFIFLGTMLVTNAQERKIKFNKGVLKICTSYRMEISGYDGDEVIIKKIGRTENAFYKRLLHDVENGTNKDSTLVNGIYRVSSRLNASGNKAELEKNLQRLGKSTSPEGNIYLDIKQKNGELIIKDYEQKINDKTLFLGVFQKYELLIPNTLKLEWGIENCEKVKGSDVYVVSSRNSRSLSNFKGNVEISSSFNSIFLVDVEGPVLVNTIGGNIKVVFDKIVPNKLYSLISNDGNIDIELPVNANLDIDASAGEIFTNLDFKIIEENIIENLEKKMRIKLNAGNVKMKLNAGYGNVYLRKK